MAPMRCLVLLSISALGAVGTASPISKVLELLGGMEEKTKAQGQEADAAFKEAEEFCRKRSDALGYSIKTNSNKKEDLEADIAKSTSRLESISASLQDSLQNTESNEAELTKATEVREKEKHNFADSEQNLLDTMDSMTRAVRALEKESASNKGKSESLLQVQQAPDIISALEAMVSGSLISSADREGLTNFLQGMQAPVAPAYKSRSGGVTEMLEDLQDKAKAELYEIRKKEAQSRGNYQLLRQSLQDEVKFAKEEAKKLQANQAEESANKASSEKDLQETATSLSGDSKELEDFTAECRRKSEDYELEKEDRAEELKALGAAKDALGKTSGAAVKTYSFLQQQVQSNAGRYPGKKVVELLREAARKSDSSAISLLARKVGNLMGEAQPEAGSDVFAKIKDMITSMISNMQKSLAEDTDHAQQCKKDMQAAKDKLAAKTSEVSDYQNKIDQAVSKSATLKSEISELQQTLSALAEAQTNATKIRNKEIALFKKNEPEIQQGIEGVQTALKVLRDYYGKDQGAATGIVALLEVVDSDFAKNLAAMRVAESTSAEDFKKDAKEMKLEKTRKEQDVKYKTQAHQQLEADLAGLQSDAESAKSVLEDEKQDAETVKAKCVVTPESFEEKQAKRQQEIDDLKAALSALEASDSSPATSLVQKKDASTLRQLRGSHAAEAMEH
eukprot:TRINITY_DN1810_c0_g1_i3.p1 TRINITY_DN1810_c0_g1~~TRINITY_DN1810_c0_g1_i3.p1  ORF type:complete len:678 (+),score=218.64 TRINITY_DN1810_c0_g1_i3:48-2081(+)